MATSIMIACSGADESKCGQRGTYIARFVSKTAQCVDLEDAVVNQDDPAPPGCTINETQNGCRVSGTRSCRSRDGGTTVTRAIDWDGYDVGTGTLEVTTMGFGLKLTCVYGVTYTRR